MESGGLLGGGRGAPRAQPQAPGASGSSSGSSKSSSRRAGGGGGGGGGPGAAEVQTPEEQDAAQQVTRPGSGDPPAGAHARGVALWGPGDRGRTGAARSGSPGAGLR